MGLARGWPRFVLPPLVGGLLALTIAPYSAVASVASAALVVLAGLVALFFRDPDRSVGEGVVAAADGRVREAADERIVTFLNLHDVHVVRAPYAGRVVDIERLEGSRRPAFLDGAERNAGVAVRLDDGGEEREVRLLCGLVARRAVAWVEAGERVERGDRIGMIRFASRVDIDVPEDATPTVVEGDRVRAGETTVAREGPP
jgi:phosphatidylserine decarboxylase